MHETGDHPRFACKKTYTSVFVCSCASTCVCANSRVRVNEVARKKISFQQDGNRGDQFLREKKSNMRQWRTGGAFVSAVSHLSLVLLLSVGCAFHCLSLSTTTMILQSIISKKKSTSVNSFFSFWFQWCDTFFLTLNSFH